MNSLKTSSIALAIAGLLFATNAYADNTASDFTDEDVRLFGAAAINAGAADSEGYTKVLSTVLSNSGAPKDLVIGLSFETMLMTSTSVGSKGGNKSESMADAEIKMLVKVDGNPAAPGEVTFDKRTQTLWAKLGGIMEDCTDLNDDGIITSDECNLTEEEIGLVLETKAAHSFNFLAKDIGSGSHTIEAYAQLTFNGNTVIEDPESGSASWDASAGLGKGTLSVWEVHGSNKTE